MLGYDFEEYQLPYIRSAPHSQTLDYTIRTLAQEKYPLLYAAMIFSKQMRKLHTKISTILNGPMEYVE